MMNCKGGYKNESKVNKDICPTHYGWTIMEKDKVYYAWSDYLFIWNL